MAEGCGWLPVRLPRMKMLALPFVVFLVACGGGEEQDDYSEVMRAAMDAPAVRVTEWGDSTAAGSQLPSGSSPLAEAQRWLSSHGYRVEANNEAVGGMPALNLLRGRHPAYLGVRFQDFPSLSWSDIGMIRSGINELRIGQSQNDFRWTLQQLVDAHRAAQKVIVLTTPSPLDPAVIGRDRVAYVKASAETVREVFRANRDIAILCDQYRYAEDAGIVTWKLDGVHPNEAATVFEGRREARCILRATELLRSSHAIPLRNRGPVGELAEAADRQ